MTDVIATEQGHWYNKRGEPCYTIIGSNGKERATDVKDARKLELAPSVTTIMKILDKPGLAEWKVKQVLLSALTLPRIEGESDTDYGVRIREDASEQAKWARDKGKAIHAEIEKALNGRGCIVDYLPYVNGVTAQLLRFTGVNNAIALLSYVDAEKSFYHPLGYGGKVDLHSRELNFVADFKCKEFTEADIDPDNKKGKKLLWDETKIQLNAYAHGLGMPDAKKLAVFVSTSVPGLVHVEEVDDKKDYFGIFTATLALFKKIKGLE